MADTYTDDLRIRLQENGQNSTTWGTITNTNLQLIEDAISGMVEIATTGGTTTLTTVNGDTDQARYAILKVTGALISNVTIEVPAKTKKYLVWNATTNAYTVTVKTSAGTGILITQNLAQELFCDATNVYPSGVATPLDSITSGVTGTGSMVRATGATLVTPALGTPSSGTLTNCTGLVPATGLSSVTGTGAAVLATSPTLVTPALGVATATSLNKITFTQPATGATVTITDGKTLAATHSLTFAGTDGTTMTFPEASAEVGFRNIPQQSKSAAYTTVLGDSGKHIYHPASDDNARIFTIDSNANVAYPIGTAITFVNLINTVTIAITSDTMYFAGTAGTTGSRTLAAYGTATALKVDTTTWIISGIGLS